MTAESVATMLHDGQLSGLFSPRLAEQLGDDGYAIAFQSSENTIRLMGAFEAEAPLADFGLMANGDIRAAHDRADCVMFVKRGADSGIVQLETSLPSAAFSVLDGGALFCRGLVFSASDVIRRGGVVFDAAPRSAGKVYYRGILVRENATFMQATDIAKARKVPLLCGAII